MKRSAADHRAVSDLTARLISIATGVLRQEQADVRGAGGRRYTNVQRYQLGCRSGGAESDGSDRHAGVLYIYNGDRTSVWVDARTPAEFESGSVPGAVNVQKGEATAANDDGRLPFQTKARASSSSAARRSRRKSSPPRSPRRVLEQQLLRWNVHDLLLAGLINHRPIVVSRNAALAAGAACTATIQAAAVDNGSYDPDQGDSLALAVAPAGPFGLGQHLVALTGTDRHGASASASAFVTVADQTAPAIGEVTVRKQLQQVRQHRVLLVTLEYAALDNCGAVTTELTVTGGAHRRWQILDAHRVLFWDEGRGSDDDDRAGDRRDSNAIVATDAAGNQTVRSVGVHGRRNDR